MKRKLLFAIVALLSIVNVQKVKAAAADYLTGWTEMTSMPTSNSEWSKYYYVFVATEADLMLAQERGGSLNGDQQENELTTVYRTPGDPAIDKKFVWMIDYDGTYLFGIRNLNNSTHYMQTRENATYRVQFAWETAQSKWTMWNLVYADSKWTIQNKLAAGDGGGDDNWIGPWSKDAFQDNMVVAGNAGGNGNAKGTFKIYRIPCKDYMTNVTSTYLTNADFSGSYSQKYTINTNRYIYQPNGWDIDYKNESTWNMTVVASTDAMASNFTGTYAVPADNQKYMVRFRDNKPSEYIDLSQTISAAAGIYTISADMIRENGSKITVKLYADDNSVENSSGNTWQNRSFTASLAEGSVKVGIKFSNLAADGVKAGVDNVKMMYKASDKTTLLATIEKAIQLNNALNDVTLATAIKTAIGVYRDIAANQTTVDAGNTAISDALGTAYASLTDGRDLTGMITNAAVTSDKGWTNGRTGSDQQYRGAPDNTYLDTWNATLNQKQTVTLPAGYYLLKVATRAIAGLGNGNVYAYANGGNLGSADIHKEGNAGNLLGNGWAWTRFGFDVSEPTSVDIGFYSECGSSKWAGADDFHLTYYTTELAMKQAHLAGVVADANAWADKVETTPALETALAASVPSCTTVDECNTAISNLTTSIAEARAAEAPYAEFNRVKAGANSIKDVEYTELTDGAYTTFTGVITPQTTVADEAMTAATVNTALSTLTSAIKTYISNAEPKNEGEYFDITCLMVNPDFNDNTITGWTKESSLNPNTRIQCNEFFGKAAFDFYQTVSGLPNGSYTLGMKAFQRPGGYDEVYASWSATPRVNNATAKVYVNSDESDVMNIMQEMNTTRIYTDPAGDDAFNSDKQPTGASGYIPNSMEGAAAWFAAGKYGTEVAALVTDGTLKLGFKDEAHTGDVWTLFDEFRLHYYGSGKMIYYKQYLPQLRTEVSADLSNGTYANVLVSSEDEALDAALVANPASETEEAYETVINNLRTAQTNFRAAATPYDAIVAEQAASAMTKITANIGTGVFQYNKTTNDNLYSAYETARASVTGYTFTTSSTAVEAQGLLDALTTAVNNYNNQALNAPDAGKRYWVTIVDDGKEWNGKAITFIAGGRNDQGNYGVKYLAVANAYMNQALKFTATTGNKYKVSALNPDGTEQYLTTANLGYEAGTDNTNKERIRTTNDASKALEIEIQATTTDNQFKLYNTDRGAIIANNDNNDVYTKRDANFTIAEASEASVELHIAAGKLATRIFPFTPTLPDGVVAYSCAANNGSSLTLTQVDTPEANKPYILYSKDGVDSQNLTGWGTATADEYTEGYLTGVYTNAVVPADSYVLQTQGSVQAFYKADGEGKSSAYRAYVTVPAETPQSGVKMFTVNLEELSDAIKTARAAGETTIRYNLAGQRVSDAQKGIVIVNGKKVLVK